MQDAIDVFIEKSLGNPLILANIATSMENIDAASVNQWQSAGRYVEKRLLRDEEFQVESGLFNEYYPKKMRATIIMAIDSLRPEERTLLQLASICEDQSIPEVVVKTFFKGIHDLDIFFKWSKELQNNNFLKIQSKEVPWRAVPETSWVVHSMHQKVIASVKAEDVTSLVTKLLKCYPEEKIIVVLLALFGLKDCREQAIQFLRNSNPELSNKHLKDASSDFSAIRPFVWLLHVDGEQQWEKESDFFVKQVLSPAVAFALIESCCGDSSFAFFLDVRPNFLLEFISFFIRLNFFFFFHGGGSEKAQNPAQNP